MLSRNIVYIKYEYCSLRTYFCILYPRPPKGRGYAVLPLSVCPSFRPSVFPSVSPSVSPSVRASSVQDIFVAFFSVTVDGRNLIYGHKRYICIPYCGQRFWTDQIPTSCLQTQLVCIHIEHICTFFVTFFSPTIDGRNLIFGHKLHIGTPYRGKRFWIHQIPTSCLPTLLIIYTHRTYMLIFRRIILANY